MRLFEISGVVVLSIYLLVGVNELKLEELPSKSFAKTLHRHADLFVAISEHEWKREYAFTSAWGHAISLAPVDNRPYLFALAVDLYHSLSPGERPSGGYNLGEVAGKVAAEDTINSILASAPESEQRTWPQSTESKASPEAREVEYLLHYLRTYVSLNPASEPPSVEPDKLNLANPTHYQPMKQWMARHATAMTEGVPPWQAEEWTTEKVGGGGYKPPPKVERPAPTTAPTNHVDQQAEQQMQPEATQQSVAPAPTQAAPQTQKQPGEQDGRGQCRLLVGLGLVIAALVAIFIFRRKKKG